MTVKQLIDALTNMDEDRPVMLVWHGYLRDITGVEDDITDGKMFVHINNEPHTG